MDVPDHLTHDIRGLVEGLASTPHVALLHALEVGEQLVHRQQLINGGDGGCNGGVVDQHVGIHGLGVEVLHGDGDGGGRLIGDEVLEGVAAAGQGDHLGDVVTGLADDHGAVGVDGEEGHGLAGVLEILQLPDHGCLLIEERGGLVLLVHQHRVELDPLGAAQGMGLIAGAIHQHGDAQILDHLLDLGGVVDHGGLDGQVAILADHQLIVRLAVLAGEEHRAGVQGLHGGVNVPAGGSGAGEADVIQGVHRREQGHGGGGSQIDPIQRLLEDGDAVVQAAGNLAVLRDDQEAAAVFNGDEGIAALVAVQVEALGVFQLRLRLEGQAGELGRSLRQGGGAAEAQQRQLHGQGQQQRGDAFHGCFHALSSLAMAAS